MHRYFSICMRRAISPPVVVFELILIAQDPIVLVHDRSYALTRVCHIYSSCYLCTGVSILVIPFSFAFVDALCIATVLGFLCDLSSTFMSMPRGGGNKVAATDVDDAKSLSQRPYQRRQKGIPEGGAVSASTCAPAIVHTPRNDKASKEWRLPGIGSPACKSPLAAGGRPTMSSLIPIEKLPPRIVTSPRLLRQAGVRSPPTPMMRSPIKSPRGAGGTIYASTASLHSTRRTLSPSRRIDSGKPGRGNSALSPHGHGMSSPRSITSVGTSTGTHHVHWVLALLASVQLIFKIFYDETQD